ncbi:MAG: type IX secretion system sortase PorU [Bacteroidales bacterium]|nr:MAG: type IX secretion system sortase PorU [Bacteroidales bacterium]
MRFLVPILLVFAVNISARNTELKRKILWGPNKTFASNIEDNTEHSSKTEYLFFEDASYSDQATLFPYYYELIKLDDYYTSKNIIIAEQVYKPIDDTDIQNVKHLKNIPDELSWETSISYIYKKPYLKLSFIPLRRNPVTNRIERLESFVIKAGNKTSAEEQDKITKSLKSYSENSVLASGKWYKISIPASGIYKLTYSELAGMNLSNPANIRIYGNGGKKLPYMNSAQRPDDIIENAIYMEKGSDNIFNEGDYILFYAQGPVTWEYNTNQGLFTHSVHPYTNASYYYLTTDKGPGKKIETRGQVTEPVTHNVTTFNDYDCHERNLNNLVKSGRQWFGVKLENTVFDTTFEFSNIDINSPVLIKANVASRAGSSRFIDVRSHNNVIGKIEIGGIYNMSSFTGAFAYQNSLTKSFTATGNSININIVYNKAADSDEGWLDYIILNARSNLILEDEALFFRDTESVGQGNVAQFSINGADNNTMVWEITDMYNISRIDASLNGAVMSFRSNTDTLKEFVVFSKLGNFISPVIDEESAEIENQNLHAIEPHNLIIVTHPDFLNEAEELAEFHRTADDMSVFVTTPDKIYNEFSSGKPDVSAIRDFVKMIYDKSGDNEDSIRYLLLFGDGSYNNHTSSPENPNFILTYQSLKSLHFSNSYVTDDFFGLLDENEGGEEDNLNDDSMHIYSLDIGVGRLPVKTPEEAQGVVNKILSYNTNKNMSDWRNVLCFVGDDGEYNNQTMHMEDANRLADYIMNNYPEYYVKKLLLDAYKQVTTSTGPRYPDVHRSIIDNFNNGMLIFNYSGHGGENGITKEQVLQKSDILELKNKNVLPLLITATCEFSRFDDVSDEEGTITEKTSAGEEALLNPEGGGIALISTTRLVFSDLNYRFNMNFYKVAFKRNRNNEKYRLGDLIKESKNETSDHIGNKLNFTLLGDPALELAYPEYKVITDSVNSLSINEELDTLKAFSKVKISGYVCYSDSTIMDNFNGTVSPSIFDKVQVKTTLGNDNINTMEFNVQENIIYKGKASVVNGRFDFSFIVPKDISYNIGKGKIIYYAEDSLIDANGYFDEFYVGGTSDFILSDNYGPEIQLYLNNDKFNTGGITDKDPVIYAEITDENGINTVGNGIGHDIIGVLDEDINGLVELNDYYHADIDKYNSGTVVYQLNDLDPGEHSLRVKVWDIFNNSSQETIWFTVIESDEIILEKVYNYPNPVVDYTTFQFEHNKADNLLKVTVDIFDLSGRIIYTINHEELASGYRSESIYWDGKNMNGYKLSKGIYPYRVRVETDDGRITDKFEKLIILN